MVRGTCCRLSVERLLRGVPDSLLIAVGVCDGLGLLHAEASLALIALGERPISGVWCLAVTPTTKGMPVDVLGGEFWCARYVDHVGGGVLHPELARDGLEVFLNHRSHRSLSQRRVDARLC